MYNKFTYIQICTTRQKLVAFYHLFLGCFRLYDPLIVEERCLISIYKHIWLNAGFDLFHDVYL